MPSRLRPVFFNPPLAVARLGGSDTPLEAFDWIPATDGLGVVRVHRRSERERRGSRAEAALGGESPES